MRKRLAFVTFAIALAPVAFIVSSASASASHPLPTTGQGGTTFVPSSTTGGVPGFPGGWPTSPTPVFPVVSGPITVDLSPLGSSAQGAAALPNAGPDIVCHVGLGQLCALLGS